MYIALIDKDLFASLLRYGEILLPDYSVAAISTELPTEEALRLILRDGNPIEYPSQYIIVIYDAQTPCMLEIGSIKELVATDADGRHLFSTQFRQDLLIQPERYKEIFQEYLDDVFPKANIKKGIVAFRALCDLEDRKNYDEEINIIYHGLINRIRYRHHFQLPAEEREEPYALMIAYDRHAPYPRGWVGYFYDVIESYCYHQKPTLGYSESVIEGTGIYKLINSLPSDSSTKFIDDTIKNERFTCLCNEFYNKPGGYLTPYLFFMLRDRFRDSDSFSKQLKLIAQMKNLFPEAFDTASIFVGGFFGYEKFYDDYYSMLNLPILKSQIPFPPAEFCKALPIEDKKQSVEVESEQDMSDVISCPKGMQKTNAACDVKDKTTYDDQATTPFARNMLHDSQVANPVSSVPNESQGDIFLDGTDLYKEMYYTIERCLSKGAGRNSILSGLSLHKDNDEALEKLRGLFLSADEKNELIKKYLGFNKKYPEESIRKVRDYFQKIENK